MQRSNSEHESLHDEEAIFFSPKSNNTPKGSSEQPRGPSASGSRSASPSRSGEHFKAALPRETSPLRGNDLKGKGRQLGYDAASNSSSPNLLASVGARRDDKQRYHDEEDDDAAMLSYGAGYDPSRDDGGDIPTLQRLVGGSHRTLDGRLPHHLPRTTPRGSSRRQGYSEHSTVEMQDSDKSSLFEERVRPLTAAEKKKEYWQSAIANLGLILSWYFFSTLISVYNKWMFSTAHYKFSYPLFVTSFHMIIQFLITGLVMWCCGDRFLARRGNGKRPRPSFKDWGAKVVPCALATATDIGLSNLSLKTITLTFYTMCKSSNLAFVLFFAFLFRLEVIRWKLIGIIVIITGGVVMMVAAETKFVVVGAVEVLTASAMGGLRWALTQLLLDREEMGLNHPIATIFWLSPIMAGGLAIASASFENWHKILGGPFFNGALRSLKTLGLITLPGLLALCMNLSEFALIQRTSVVTLSVAGIFKEVLTVIVASAIFGDELTPINISGLCITIFGIALYNWLRYQTLTKARAALHTSDIGGSYAQVPTGERNGPADSVVFDQDEEGGSRSKTPSIAMSETRLADSEVSESEKERRRKREEEADMVGWETSGFVKTGNGLVESDED